MKDGESKMKLCEFLTQNAKLKREISRTKPYTPFKYTFPDSIFRFKDWIRILVSGGL